MVAGQLKVMGSPKKQQSICVLKIADLSSNPHSEALWMAEVIHMQSHFKDQQNVWGKTDVVLMGVEGESHLQIEENLCTSLVGVYL